MYAFCYVFSDLRSVLNALDYIFESRQMRRKTQNAQTLIHNRVNHNTVRVEMNVTPPLPADHRNYVLISGARVRADPAR